VAGISQLLKAETTGPSLSHEGRIGPPGQPVEFRLDSGVGLTSGFQHTEQIQIEIVLRTFSKMNALVDTARLKLRLQVPLAHHGCSALSLELVTAHGLAPI